MSINDTEPTAEAINGTAGTGYADAQRGALDEHAEAIRACGKRTVEAVLEIGRRLAEAKKLLGFGNFLPWIEREFGWSEDTAERFIALHALQRQIPQVAEFNLPISGLYLLARRSTPPEAVQAVVAMAQAGEPVTVTDVKAAIANEKPFAPPKAEPPPEPPPQPKQPAAPEPTPIEPDDEMSELEWFRELWSEIEQKAATGDQRRLKEAVHTLHFSADHIVSKPRIYGLDSLRAAWREAEQALVAANGDMALCQRAFEVLRRECVLALDGPDTVIAIPAVRQ